MNTPEAPQTTDLPVPVKTKPAFWVHLQKYRETYLFPLVAIAVLYLGIQCVHLLTGRAILDDPGSIVSALYNAIIVIVAVSILGALQGHQIPDVDEDGILASLDKDKPWHVNLSTTAVHLINALCTIIVFYLLLKALFAGASAFASA